MKKILFILSLFISGVVSAQVYNPSIHVVINDAMSPAPAVPLDGRTQYFDPVNFLYRPFQNTAEALSYLPIANYRWGNAIIVIDSGGTLQSNGKYLNPHNTFWMFRDSTTNGGLIKMWLFGDAPSPVPQNLIDTIQRVNDSTFSFTQLNGHVGQVLLRGTAAGGINSLQMVAPAALFNSPVSFANSSGAWTGALVLNNQSANSGFFGPVSGVPAQPSFRPMVIADLPLGIPNGNLANSTIGVYLGTTGTSPNLSTNTIALGGSVTLNLPIASNVNTGVISAFDWTRFNTAVNQLVTSVNGQIGATVVGNADSINGYPVTIPTYRNNYVLTFDSTGNYWYLSPGGGGGSGVSIVTSGNIPNLATVNVATNTSTPAFTFTPISESANLFYASPNGSSGNPGWRGIVNADLPTSGVSAGTYNSVTVNNKGIVTSASNVGTGITSLNSLTATTQLFATGSSGTNFNISSVTATHTFNIPYANNSDTGLVIPSQVISWNAKQSALTFPQSVLNTGGAITLVNDAASPGNGYYYGTNASGVKGYFQFATDTTFIKNYGASGLGLAWVNNLSDTINMKKLIGGAGISLIQNADSSITINVSGAGTGTVSAAINGTSLSVTGDSVLWGGSLTQNTTIAQGSYTVNFTGSQSTSMLTVTNSGSGSAIIGNVSGSGVGVTGLSTTGEGGFFSSSQGLGLQANVDPTGTNTSVQAFWMTHTISGGGTAANGIGVYWSMSAATTANGNEEMVRGEGVFTNATTATRTSQFNIYNWNSGTMQTAFSLLGTGQTQLPLYGIGTFTGTPTYNVLVDATGHLIEGSVPVGSSTQAANGLSLSVTGDSVLLGGSNLYKNVVVNGLGFTTKFTGTSSDGVLLTVDTASNGDIITNLLGGSGSGIVSEFTKAANNNTSIDIMMELNKRVLSGSAHQGSGEAIYWGLSNNTPSSTQGMLQSLLITDSIAAAFATEYHINLTNAGGAPATDQYIFKSTGQPRFSQMTPSNSSLIATAGDTTNFKPVLMDASGNIWRGPSFYGGGGGGGGNFVGRDSVLTITSGSSSTVTNGYNVILFNPATALGAYTLTLPTTWHTSNTVTIVFGGTIASGSPVVTLTIVGGSGQSVFWAVPISGTTFQSGEAVTFKLVSGNDYRIN